MVNSLIFLLGFSHALKVSIVKDSSLDNETAVEWADRSLVRASEWSEVTCVFASSVTDFVTIENPTVAYYDMVYYANERLPYLTAKFNWLLIHMFGIGTPLWVMLYIMLAYFLSYRRRLDCSRILGGLEHQVYYMTMASGYIGFANTVGFPMMAASTTTTVPWVMLFISIAFVPYCILVIASLYGFKPLKCCLVRIHGHSMAVEDLEEGDDVTLQISSIGDGERHDVSPFANHRAVLVLGKSELPDLIGKPWSKVFSNKTWHSTVCHLLYEVSLCYPSAEGQIMIAPFHGRKFESMRSYDCASRDDMMNMMYQLMHGQTLSKIIKSRS